MLRIGFWGVYYTILIKRKPPERVSVMISATLLRSRVSYREPQDGNLNKGIVNPLGARLFNITV